MADYHSDVLLGLLQAQNLGDVHEFQDMLRDRLGDRCRILPIGGDPLTAWDENGGPKLHNAWNNRSHGLAVSNPLVAVNERIKNGDDAVADYLWKSGQFARKPADAAEADRWVAEMSNASKERRAFTFLLATEEQAGGCRTANIIDMGTGIRGDEFDKTICGRGSIAKLGSGFQVGNLGYGANVSLRFCDAAVIASRHYEEPGMIAFTVAYATELPGIGLCYVWDCDQNGHAFLARVADLDPALITSPDELNGRNVKELVRGAPQSGRVFLPRMHGTSVRMIGYDIPTWGNLYHQMRDIGFGVATPHCLINGMYKQKRGAVDDDDGEDEVDDTGPGKNDIRYSVGMRHILNGDRARNLYPTVYHQPAVAQTIDGFGEVSIEAWVLDAKNPNKLAVDGLRLRHPLIITSNGGVHHGEPSKRLLDDVRLTHLEKRIVIEVSLDAMTDTQRDKVINSDREKAVEKAVDEIKAAVKRFLRGDGNFDAMNRMFRDRAVLDGTSVSHVETLGRVTRLLGRLTGSVFNNWGGEPTGTMGAPDPRQVRRNVEGGQEGVSTNYGGKTSSYKPRLIEERDPPTYIKLRKSTIKVGHQEYFNVETDASAKYRDQIGLELPVGLRWVPINDAASFLTDIPKSRKGLQNGRDGFLLQCHPNTPVGTTEAMRAVLLLPDGGKLVSREIEVEVIEPTEPKKVQVEKPMMPDISVHRAKPPKDGQPGQNWAGMNAPKNVDFSKLAFNYSPSPDGAWDCWVNEEFGVYERMVADLKAKGYGPRVIEQFQEDAMGLIVRAATLHCLDNSEQVQNGSETDIKDLVDDDVAFHRAKAVAWANALTVRYLAIIETKSK